MGLQPSTVAMAPLQAGTHRQDICIVGGGFSGCMVAANLMRLARGHRAPLRVHLIERRDELGRGAAYATRDPVHLLNVPAKGMSAWVASPDDFLSWVRLRQPDAQPGDFLPRSIYSDYVRHALAEVERAAGDAVQLVRVHDEAVAAEMRPDGSWFVTLASGARIDCDAVVLATGHRPPGDPLGGRWQGPIDRWIGDPWRPGATDAIGADDAVLIVGSGLTAMDLLLTLDARHPARSGPVMLVSRSGLLPRVHAESPVEPVDPMPMLNDLALGGRVTSMRDLLRAVRRVIGGRRGLPARADWRAVIDGLRPYTHGLWAALPERERRRFARHVRSFWEVHRHRMAPRIGAHIEALQAQGFFDLIRGRPTSAEAGQGLVRVTLRERRRGSLTRERTVEAQWVVNCTGPSPTVGHAEDRFAASLIAAGLARMDPLGLGLETDFSGRPIGRSGRSSGGLWVVGSLRRPALWETTAVPELRAQAEMVARECVASLA
jgi:uncharacterized NAD(P)/FAD-binding protein YdhS